MPSQLTNYKCPACTGPLHFVGGSGRLECDYCGSTYTVKEIEELMQEAESQAAQAQATAEAKAEETAAQAQQEAAENGEMWDPKDGDMRSYNCPSCGAEILCDATTAATSCPYCGNPTIIPGQFSGVRKPDFIIPFKLDKNAAVAALKKHYGGKKLLPKAFTAGNHIEEVKGVYVPFWLYDGKVSADVRYDATRTRVVRTPREMITETDHFILDRQGTVDFSRMPADASKKMPDGHMDSIEPFDYGELRPFSTAYMPGYYADKYDVDSEECFQRFQRRTRQTVVSAMAQTVVGYETVMPVQEDVEVMKHSTKYAMLPVWLLSTRWNGQNFLFAMNGQTGKLVGDLPVSMGRFWAWFFAIFGIGAVILALLLFFLL